MIHKVVGPTINKIIHKIFNTLNLKGVPFSLINLIITIPSPFQLIIEDIEINLYPLCIYLSYLTS